MRIGDDAPRVDEHTRIRVFRDDITASWHCADITDQWLDLRSRVVLWRVRFLGETPSLRWVGVAQVVRMLLGLASAAAPGSVTERLSYATTQPAWAVVLMVFGSLAYAAACLSSPSDVLRPRWALAGCVPLALAGLAGALTTQWLGVFDAVAAIGFAVLAAGMATMAIGMFSRHVDVVRAGLCISAGGGAALMLSDLVWSLQYGADGAWVQAISGVGGVVAMAAGSSAMVRIEPRFAPR